MKLKINISNLNCMMCAKSIEAHFKKLNISSKINITDKSVIFEGSKNINFKFMSKELSKIGFNAISANSKEINKALLIEKLILITTSLLVVPFLILVLGHFKKDFLPWIFHEGLFQIIFAAPVQFIIGARFYKGAFYQIKKKNPGMDVLVSLGTSIAFGYSLYLFFFTNTNKYYFQTSSLIIWMVIIGDYLEYISKNRSTTALKELLMLTPKTSIKVVNNKDVNTPISELKVGDIIKVLPNQIIPIDSLLLFNESFINEASITGEYSPKYKKTNDQVYGGTINLGDTILLKVDKIGSDTVLNKIIQAVEEAQLIKPKYQRLADVISKYFVLIIIIIALISFISAIFITNKNITTSLEIAISILVISCPCALGLATPTSIACASSVAYKNKILFKDANFFELSSKVDAICFDKTGTLTKQNLKVIKIIGDPKYYDYIYSIEAQSIHPIGKAISSYLTNAKSLELVNYKIIPSVGIKANIKNKEVMITKYDYLNNLYNPFESNISEFVDNLVLKVFIDNELTNLIILENNLKDEAIKIIQYLKKRKITPYILTGDTFNNTKPLADKLGIVNYYHSLLPQDKSNIIKELQKKHKMVAFIGDGINDAPSLKQANLSISVASAADIAQEASDIALIKDDLYLVLLAFDLSRKTRINIIENLSWAFVYNIVTIPLAISNIIPPVIAGSLHIISSLTVVFNALRIKLYRFNIFNKKKIKFKKNFSFSEYNVVTKTLEENNIEHKLKINDNYLLVNKEDYQKTKVILKHINILED